MALFSKPHAYDLQADEILSLLQSLAGNEPMPPVKVPPHGPLVDLYEAIAALQRSRQRQVTEFEQVKRLAQGLQDMARKHQEGWIDEIIPADQLHGVSAEIARDINELVNAHIAVKMKVVKCVTAYAKGDFSIDMDRLPGKKAAITSAIDAVKEALQEADMATKEANQALTCLAVGDTRQEITGEYKGVFAQFKQNFNLVNHTVRNLIAQLQHMATEHDKGDIDVVLDTNMFNGDFKRITQSINDMVAGHITVKKKAMACIKEFGEGNFDAPLESFPGKKAFINQTIEKVRGNLKALIADTRKLADAAAEGDIEVRADANQHQGDFRSIIEGINQTLEKILGPIITVKRSADAVTNAAKEIAAGNADLSSRTEEQASSLEETASSMDELASTVKQNAENAKQASQLATVASTVAAKGGTVVGQVVSTMVSINESSRKIVDIISVIDGIAFQTNILALNAAVEAARAGEQGRGFAVVAGEVRNLAQRSAAAAKEIKQLISDSVDKVEGGTKLVEQAGQTMEEIVSSVKRVTDIMADIASASVQQSSGIDQVNIAIVQMDETTQQNAALVEQAAAAAESLEEQAQAMSEAVRAFKLRDSENIAPVSAPIKKPIIKKPLTAARPKTARQEKPSKQDAEEWEEF